MPNFARLAENLNVEPVLGALNARPELWDEITARQDHPGSPHHDTRCIWARGPRELSIEAVFNDVASTDYPAMHTLAPELYPLMNPVLRTMGVEHLGRVLITTLKPGGAIDPHEDQGLYAKTFSRFHIALSSKPGNVFGCGAEQVHMKPGELWWFNHRDEHWLRNDSDEERIHIIFDAIAPGFEVQPLASMQRNPAAGLRIVEMPMVGLIDTLWPLFEQHWDEIARNKQVMVLNPDRARYEQMEAAGMLLALAVVTPDGEVVGYSVNLVGPHLHYADLTVCNNDVLFLREDLRNSPIGLKLVRETTRAAAARGARLMLWHAKENTSLAKILPRMGYGVQDIIFSKEIG